MSDYTSQQAELGAIAKRVDDADRAIGHAEAALATARMARAERFAELKAAVAEHAAQGLPQAAIVAAVHRTREWVRRTVHSARNSTP
jgi:hypothetical protein